MLVCEVGCDVPMPCFFYDSESVKLCQLGSFDKDQVVWT